MPPGRFRKWWRVARHDKGPQPINAPPHGGSLAGEIRRGGRSLASPGGVFLRDVVQLRHGGADLADALRLFLGRGGDLGHELVGSGDPFADLTERQTDPLAAGRTQAAALDGRLDPFGGFPSGRGAPLGQRPHLVGNHGEARSCLTRAGRLDRGVQGQDVGLEGDLVDLLHDLGDLRARRAD